jgi:hypothetical protein
MTVLAHVRSIARRVALTVSPEKPTDANLSKEIR